MTLRVNGRAHLSVEPELLESFVDGGQGAALRGGDRGRDGVFPVRASAGALGAVEPREVTCDPSSLPTRGQMLAALSNGTCGGETWDREWPARARASLW